MLICKPVLVKPFSEPKTFTIKPDSINKLRQKPIFIASTISKTKTLNTFNTPVRAFNFTATQRSKPVIERLSLEKGAKTTAKYNKGRSTLQI